MRLFWCMESVLAKCRSWRPNNSCVDLSIRTQVRWVHVRKSKALTTTATSLATRECMWHKRKDKSASCAARNDGLMQRLGRNSTDWRARSNEAYWPGHARVKKWVGDLSWWVARGRRRFVARQFNQRNSVSTLVIYLTECFVIWWTRFRYC